MATSSEDDIMLNAPDEEDDLFGDEELIERTRELSDKELDSGDDEDRHDRAPKDDVELFDDTGRDARVLEQTVFRHPIPKPANGELSILRLPKFLGIAPLPYEPETFRVPTSDHHTDTKSANFSASAIALSTIRYRKHPRSNRLESNTVLYKWSDGSTTLSVGDQHYELQNKSLAPPLDSKTYLDVQDSHQYLASPSLGAQLLVTVGHLTNQYTVRPNKDIEDDALEKLQKSLAAATRGGNKGDDKGGPELITNTQDPELQKKQAEIAEKERMRAQRRRETAAEKHGIPRISGGARSTLHAGDLEGTRKGGARKPAGPRRRRPDYDSDDEPRGRGYAMDEYDKEDDFVASSDEELEEGVEDEEEEEELVDDESEREQPKVKKQKTSKAEDVSDADVDAEADLDDEDAPAVPITADPGIRGRKRNVIEDDEDE